VGIFSNLFRKKQVHEFKNIENDTQHYPKMKKGEILPAGEMKLKYNLTIENYKPRPLNPINVPEQLRDLVFLAQKWGIGDDIIRNDLHHKVSDEDKQTLKAALNGRIQTISQWLDSFGSGKMTEEAASFMYMLEGLDEMGIQVDLGPEFQK